MRRLVFLLCAAAAALGPTVAAAASGLFDRDVSPVRLQAAVVDLDESGPLTLERALALAAARSHLVSAARWEREASDAAVRQADVLPNPEIAASVEDTRRDSRTTTSTVNFTLERGGKREARVTAAQRARDLADADLGRVQSELEVAVIDAFFAVLAAQERVELERMSAETARRAAEAAARRVLAGRISPVDETRAQVEQANAELELTQAEAGLRSARYALGALWGNPNPAFTHASGKLVAVPTRPPPEVLVAHVEEAPVVLENRLEVERRMALIGIERSKQSPDVVLSVGAKRDNELGRTQAVVGISIPLPLFDRNEGNVLAAMKRVESARARYQDAKIRVRSELQLASNLLMLASTTSQTLSRTVIPAAQQAYEAAVKGFQAGKFDFLYVLDAQRTLLQARSRYLDSLAEAFRAATAIDRILGRQHTGSENGYDH